MVSVRTNQDRVKRVPIYVMNKQLYLISDPPFKFQKCARKRADDRIWMRLSNCILLKVPSQLPPPEWRLELVLSELQAQRSVHSAAVPVIGSRDQDMEICSVDNAC